MKQITINISDLQVSNDPDTTLVTFALGSCIAVMVYDPVTVAGGMIHYMLPNSSANKDKAREKPAMFADTGIPLLFESMYKLGCSKANLIVKVAGGGCLQDTKGMFKIGQRNYTILRKMFWKSSVLIASEDVGGTKSRTVRLRVGDGYVTVTSKGEEMAL